MGISWDVRLRRRYCLVFAFGRQRAGTDARESERRRPTDCHLSTNRYRGENTERQSRTRNRTTGNRHQTGSFTSSSIMRVLP